MREKIIEASIEALKKEGLKFSVDTLADNLKISKKTVYKFFPDKQALALALYEKYYTDALCKVKALVRRDAVCKEALLLLYFDAKMMTRKEIFNKYTLHEAVHAFTARQNDALWLAVASSWDGSAEDKQTLRLIVDGTFEKLCTQGVSPNAVIKRLVDLI
ncbi:MAG: TetR/AcrR family transcriptional regulator [Acutalibacteraceae bacterium]